MSQSQDQVQKPAQVGAIELRCLVYPDGTVQAIPHSSPVDSAADDAAARQDLVDLFAQIDKLSAEISTTQAVNKQLRQESHNGLTELAKFIAKL